MAVKKKTISGENGDKTVFTITYTLDDDSKKEVTKEYDGKL